MSSVNAHAVHVDRPERSRNAKAQARHRAKRKAYIEQLEQTVTKLQAAYGLTHEEIAVLPPPLIRIRELEQENARLIKENEDLRRMLTELGRSPDGVRRGSTYQDPPRVHDRANDYKRRKYNGELEGGYMSPSDTPPQMHEPIRPPPLTIPQSVSNPYQYASSNQHVVSGSSSLFSLHATSPFQMPNTPSGSSATSSPPFSVSRLVAPRMSFPGKVAQLQADIDFYLQPAQMQEPIQSPADHRASSMGGTHNMSNYSSRNNGHYSPVKIEEENYAVSSAF
ncbi:hypothetical protein H0H93_005602 [Arthromyces matolae]|nr:hypothetical protein H0H93_005602 [Arthromyces matolae]